eukprot:SAG11_NODE_18656_length_484_cov_1.602597_1_plen_43_part_10
MGMGGAALAAMKLPLEQRKLLETRQERQDCPGGEVDAGGRHAA